jgi:hypothetical protein
MKNLVIIVFVFFTALAINAQPYQSIFYKDTTRWTSFECVIDGFEYFTSSVYDDTTINDVKYKIIHLGLICAPNFNEIIGFLREDTITGRVWYKPNFDEDKDEFLIMDLGLEKGDSFEFTTDTYYQSIEKITVDTVFYENELKVIQFKTDDYSCVQEIHFIESIGLSNGFSYPNHDPFDYALIFKHNNSELFYTSPNIEWFGFRDNCETAIKANQYQPFFEIQSITDNGIDLYIYEKQESVTLIVYDIKGQVVFDTNLHEGLNQLSIDRKGVHIFSLNIGAKVTSFKLCL